MARFTLATLLEYNNERSRAFRDSPFFSVTSGELEDAQKRDVFLACIQRFSTNFQTIMLTRQALCADPIFSTMFRKHLAEEIDHDRLISQREGAREIDDPIFEAIATWFSYQMIVLDNVDKTALVHLVLETAGDLFHGVAAEVLGKHVRTGYFEMHAQLDEGHAELGTSLLTGLAEDTYKRLSSLVRQGWDMIDTAAARVTCLVREVDNGH